MTEIFAAADEVVEELFPPKPGGLVDRHRKRRAAEEAQEEIAKDAQERIEQPAFKSVKVAPQGPEEIAAQTITIGAGGTALVLPMSPYRFRATILLVTSAATIVLAKDQSAALGNNGFQLPAGIPFPVYSRAQLWAFNPGGSAVTVSILAEIYAPES